MEAEVGEPPEQNDQPLGPRETARHPRWKPTEKNGVCDQQRDTDRGIEEDSHAEIPVDDITIWNKMIILVFPVQINIFT
jgi:hypothetical protein